MSISLFIFLNAQSSYSRTAILDVNLYYISLATYIWQWNYFSDETAFSLTLHYVFHMSVN